MALLVRSVLIVDAASPYHGQTLDLLVDGGQVKKIGSNLEASEAEVLESPDQNGPLCASPGWLDTFAHFCDPGKEHREDLASGAAAAAAGGFTGVVVVPNTDPVLHSKAELEYIRSRSSQLPIHIYPYGAISRHNKGYDIAELYDMREAGAVAFTEGNRPLRHAGLMLHALRYVQPFNGLVVNLPLDLDMAGKAGVHEGTMAIRLGLPGIPGMAEALMVQRDLQLLEYTGGRLHFALISGHRSVDLIREAKAKGQEVTAGVAAYQLLYDDQALGEFDSNFKVLPPLRAARDREALISGLLDGTIDLVCSNHMPQHEDEKRLEFEYASYGINGLETAFSALCMALGAQAGVEKMVQWLCTAPRTLLDLPPSTIQEGANADLTFFRPKGHWTPQSADLRSRSRNNPMLGQPLTGTVEGVYARGRFIRHAQTVQA